MAQQTTASRTFPPGTVLDITFADHGVARYMVDREWENEEEYDGLRVSRVRGGYDSTLPRYAGSLYPDDKLLRHNFVEDQREREEDDSIPETYDVERMDVVSLEERVSVDGSLDSPRASHVKRAVIDAIADINNDDADDDVYAGSEWLTPESFTIQAAGERSDSDCVVLWYAASLDLHAEEAIRETVREHLKDHYAIGTVRKGVWEFRYDDTGIERPVK